MCQKSPNRYTYFLCKCLLDFSRFSGVTAINSVISSIWLRLVQEFELEVEVAIEYVKVLAFSSFLGDVELARVIGVKFFTEWSNE